MYNFDISIRTKNIDFNLKLSNMSIYRKWHWFNWPIRPKLKHLIQHRVSCYSTNSLSVRINITSSQIFHRTGWTWNDKKRVVLHFCLNNYANKSWPKTSWLSLLIIVDSKFFKFELFVDWILIFIIRTMSRTMWCCMPWRRRAGWCTQWPRIVQAVLRVI